MLPNLPIYLGILPALQRWLLHARLFAQHPNWNHLLSSHRLYLEHRVGRRSRALLLRR